MKAHITTLALALLAGTVTAGTQPRQRCSNCTVNRSGAPQQQAQSKCQPNQKPQAPQWADPTSQSEEGVRAPDQCRKNKRSKSAHSLTPEQRQRRKQHVMKRFDRDGDGQLSQTELAAAKKARQAHFEKRRATKETVE